MDLQSRLDFYSRGNAFVADHDAKICSFTGADPSSLGYVRPVKHSEGSAAFKVVSRLGDSGKYGEIYLISSMYKKKPLDAAIKIMPINRHNKDEVDYYTHFNKIVISSQNPHYPLVFHSRVCNNCPFHDRPKDSCYMLMKEVADGDLKNWLKRKHPSEAYMSFWAQLCISGFALEQHNMVHDDLHWGNVLYHKVPKAKGKYMHYTVGSHNVYIKIHGEHWVLWDFGLSIAAQPPYITSLKEDMERISGIARWADSRHAKNKKYAKAPKVLDNLCNDVKLYTSSIGSTYLDFLLYLEDIIKKHSKTVLLIDPPTPPAANKLINSDSPYLVA